MKALKILLLMLPLTAIYAQPSIYRHREALETNYITSDSIHVNHAYIETLDAHSPIHVVAPLYLYYGADTSAYISWYVTHFETVFANTWGDTAEADTTDTVCVGDSILGDVYVYKLPTCSPDDRSGFVDTSNFGSFVTDTTVDKWSNFPCVNGDTSCICITIYHKKNDDTVAAVVGDTVFLYYYSKDQGAVTDSFIIVGVDGPKGACWKLYGCKSRWEKIISPCIPKIDTLYQIFGSDTFMLREKRNY